MTIRYVESPPPAEWDGVVEAVWRVDARVGDTIRVLPDACTDLIALDDTAAAVLFVGPMTRAEETELRLERTVGIRLRPGVRLELGAGTGLRGLRDREVRLGNGASQDGDPEAGLLGLLADLRCTERIRTDPQLDRLLDAIVAERTSIAEACRRVGVSERTAERLFDEFVGLTPRQCVGVLRHIGIGRALRAGPDSIAELAAAHGYADQPHLTRDFGRLAGIQPARFVREVERDGFVQDLIAPDVDHESTEEE